MKQYLLLAFIICFTIAVDPPIWPQHFYQKFVESYQYTQLYTTGQFWYDAGSNKERVDRSDGSADRYCGNVLPKVSTSCSLLYTNNNLYIVYPQKKQCCRCCNSSHGQCAIAPRDWITQSVYVGTQNLSGQEFYKWSSQDRLFYYSTMSPQRIPRRVRQVDYSTSDFIMNSYSQDSINQSVFNLPSYCKSDCPRSTICGKIQPGNSQKSDLKAQISQ